MLSDALFIVDCEACIINCGCCWLDRVVHGTEDMSLAGKTLGANNVDDAFLVEDGPNCIAVCCCCIDDDDDRGGGGGGGGGCC